MVIKPGEEECIHENEMTSMVGKEMGGKPDIVRGRSKNDNQDIRE